MAFLDEMGHEMGMVEDLSGLDADSRSLLQAELKDIYFVPTILEVRDVNAQGISHRFKVLTDDGEATFTVDNLDALDGSHPPGILIRCSLGKRYSIDDYWDLNTDSRERMATSSPGRYCRPATAGIR